MTAPREGSLEAPTRHPLDWKNPDFFNRESLDAELGRVFDLCHGCRRCVSLCNSFPTLFDLVDESSTMEVDGVAKADYQKVVDGCFLCDLCYMTKCPYTPPHEWNIDFPHLMLRAKAVAFKEKGAKFRDKLLTSTDAVGKIASKPGISTLINTVNNIKPARKVMDKALGIAADAWVPPYNSNTLRKQLSDKTPDNKPGNPAGQTTGKVALFTTCYGNYNEPSAGLDITAIFEHNGIAVTIAAKERCCGMPKLELGDLEAVERAKNANIPILAELVDGGYDIVAPIPSCALMFKQELPLMFPDDMEVIKVAAAIFDPFEYLMIRHKDGALKTDFKNPLGTVAYHASCHQRVQNIGRKTKEVLELVPGVKIEIIERCSGHDGTYAVKSEQRKHSLKIVRPVVTKVKKADPDHYGSDCVMAGHHIENSLDNGKKPQHPMSLLRQAYGI